MFFIENQNSKTYLVYELSENDVIDNLTLGMMNNNYINGFLRMSYSQIDEKKFFKYDISSKIPAVQIFSAPVNRKWVVGVFKSIANSLLSSEEYMINKNSFILNLDYIFVDISRNEAFIICMPLLNRKEVDFCGFFKQIMFSSKFDQSENCSYVANIISCLNGMNSFNSKEFITMLNSLDNTYSSKSQIPMQVNFGSMKVQPQIPKKKTVSMSPQPTAPVSDKPTFSQTFQPIETQAQQPAQNAKTSVIGNPEDSKNFVKADKKNGKAKYPQNTNMNNTGFAIPNTMDRNINNRPGTVQNSLPEQQASQKKMSMFYLMCHYNKENAAIYKAQKNQGGQMNGEQQAQIPVMNNNVQTPANNSTPPAKSGFAIPGVSTPINPNQPAPQAVQVKPAPNAVPPMPNNMQNNLNNNGVQSAPMSMQMPNSNVVQPQFMNNNVQPVQPNTVPVQPQNMDFSNFGETTVLGGGNDGETTVLGDLDSTVAPSVKQPFIIRMSNNEKIAVNKPVYRIGKERSYVDYFIGDNSYVSRGHANIISRDGKYYIVDNNSRNHTFVNGEVITSSTEVELKNGDTFKLANEAFEFKLF